MGLPQAASNIYHRSYAPLKRISWPWRFLTVFASFATWLSTIPWMVLRQLTPQQYQGQLDDLETWFLSTFTGIINFGQDMVYNMFKTFDWLIDTTINNATWFYNNWIANNMEWMLREGERRTSILQNQGLNGIGEALSFGTTMGHTHAMPMAATGAGKGM